MRRFTARLKTVTFVPLLVCLVACSTAPLSQRRQVILVSEEQEIALGEVLHREALRQSIFSQDVEANRLVQKVGRRVAQVINRPDYSWEFVVVDDPEIVNAWVFPGGKVGVYTGLFPVVDDEAGLAVILCH